MALQMVLIVNQSLRRFVAESTGKRRLRLGTLVCYSHRFYLDVFLNTESCQK